MNYCAGYVRQQENQQLGLQPELVRTAVGRARPKDPLRRRNAAYVGQGEWFFVPVTLRPEPSASEIARNEPLSRGRGKAHMMQFAFRTGGRRVYVVVLGASSSSARDASAAALLDWAFA